MRLRLLFLLAVLLGFTSLWFAANVQPQAKVGDEELKIFAKVYIQYHAIRRHYSPSLEKARSEKERQDITAKARAEVQRVLDKHGVTVDAYNRIFKAVNSDEELRKKTLKLINKERAKP